MVQIRINTKEYSGNTEKRLQYLSSSSLSEVFPNSFMSEFTHHENFTDFCKAIGCNITSQNDLNKLQNTNAYNEAIRLNSNFSSWQEMIETAYQKLVDKK